MGPSVATTDISVQVRLRDSGSYTGALHASRKGVTGHAPMHSLIDELTIVGPVNMHQTGLPASLLASEDSTWGQHLHLVVSHKCAAQASYLTLAVLH